MGQARNRAKTFEERQKLALDRIAAETAVRESAEEDRINLETHRVLGLLAAKSGDTALSLEEVRALSTTRKIELQRIFHRHNADGSPRDPQVVKKKAARVTMMAASMIALAASSMNWKERGR